MGVLCCGLVTIREKCVAKGDLPRKGTVSPRTFFAGVLNKELFPQQEHGYPCVLLSADVTLCLPIFGGLGCG